MSSGIKTQMLESFLHKNNVDILCAQEVVADSVITIRGYTTYANIGTTHRGTAFMVKDTIVLTHITTLPSGRGIAARYRDIDSEHLRAVWIGIQGGERHLFQH
jgi:exonuclease III